MTDVVDLAPHDPLPDGPAIVLLRRFEEDDPHRIMIEIVALDDHHTESNVRLTTRDGAPPAWEEATRQAVESAERAGMPTVFRIDRTAGPREREILARHGDHGTGGESLDDDDLEDGETGSDMRDGLGNAAPRRF